MHKIDTQTAVNGEFTDGNPSTGVKATQLNAGWFNSVQREICNAVEKFGFALSKEDDMQLWKVVSALGVKTFSPWEGDFGVWSGNSVIVMDAVETVYFPVPDRCPKNAIAIVSVPWMESDTSLTVAQNEGSSAPLFRGNIGLVFFDANGYASEVKNMPVSATGIPLLFLYAMEGKLETLTVNGEAKLPGATFTPATSSGGVPVAKLAYLKVLESLDVEKGMTVKGKAEFERVNADSLEVGTAKASDMKTGSIISGRFKLPKEGDAPYQNISADCFHDTDSDYTLDGGVGSIEYVYNSGTAQIKVILGNRVSDGASLYVYLNAGCCCGFICVSSYDSGHRWAPMFNAVVQVDTE